MKETILRKIKWFNQLVGSFFFCKKIHLKLEQPLIAFTFDDVPAVSARTAAAILDNYHSKGTFYVASSLTINKTGYLTPLQIGKLIEEGHELACHTYSHIRTTRCSSNKLRKEIELNRNYFKDNFDGYELVNFSYPSGAIGLWNKRLLGKMYWSSRGSCQGINKNNLDLNSLKAYKLYSSKMTFDKISKIISENIKKKGLLIFYTHDVAESPSRYGCTPSLFQYAVDTAHKSGAKVVTVKEALLDCGFIR